MPPADVRRRAAPLNKAANIRTRHFAVQALGKVGAKTRLAAGGIARVKGRRSWDYFNNTFVLLSSPGGFPETLFSRPCNVLSPSMILTCDPWKRLLDSGTHERSKRPRYCFCFSWNSLGERDCFSRRHRLAERTSAAAQAIVLPRRRAAAARA
jgi:hypothetical protein